VSPAALSSTIPLANQTLYSRRCASSFATWHSGAGAHKQRGVLARAPSSLPAFPRFPSSRASRPSHAWASPEPASHRVRTARGCLARAQAALPPRVRASPRMHVGRLFAGAGHGLRAASGDRQRERHGPGRRGARPTASAASGAGHWPLAGTAPSPRARAARTHSGDPGAHARLRRRRPRTARSPPSHAPTLRGSPGREATGSSARTRGAKAESFAQHPGPARREPQRHVRGEAQRAESCASRRAPPSASGDDQRRARGRQQPAWLSLARQQQQQQQQQQQHPQNVQAMEAHSVNAAVPRSARPALRQQPHRAALRPAPLQVWRTAFPAPCCGRTRGLMGTEGDGTSCWMRPRAGLVGASAQAQARGRRWARTPGPRARGVRCLLRGGRDEGRARRPERPSSTESRSCNQPWSLQACHVSSWQT